MAEVFGAVAPGFEAVRDGFAEGQDLDAGGAQLAIYRGSERVVDLWCGRDAAADRPYGPDTLTVIMSCTKAVASTMILRLVERGLIDLDAPVARYWPAFAAAGKDGVTIAHLLSHASGLAAFDPDAGIGAEELLDWETSTSALAAMAPLWSPGTAYIYHFFTHGYLLGEVARQVTGKTIGALVAEEIAGPLGLDLWIGLPDAEQSRVAEHFSSNARLAEGQLNAGFKAMGIDTNDRLVRAMVGTMVTTEALIDLMKTPRGRAAEIPAGNGVGNARSLAKFYAALIGEVNGVRLLSPAMVEAARTPRTDRLRAPGALEPITGPAPQRFGLGFELARAALPMLSKGSFGHPGAGGRFGYADPASGYAVAYVCNNLLWDGANPDPRWVPWSNALAHIVHG